MKLSDIKPNPNNPRVIKDDRFHKLVKSIREFPKMMSLRPIVIDSKNIVLGGNMRLKAMQHLGFKEIPDDWVKKASELTEEEQKRFIIADNVGFGEHDWEMLSNEWDVAELADWGLDAEKTEPLEKKETQKINPYNKSHILISFNPNDYSKIQSIIEALYEFDSIEIEQSAN